MKNIKLAISLSFVMLFAGFACQDEDFVVYGNEEFQQVADPFLRIKTPLLSFQAGTPSYHMEFDVINGSNRLNSIDIYMTFTDANTGATSNEALLGTYTMDAGGFTRVTDELTYDDLKAGLTVNGGPLPDDQAELAVGSLWVFRLVGHYASGIELKMSGSIRVGVLSRFAGFYRVVESVYFRIGVNSGNWTGQTRFIGSVDATTFSYNDWWGLFAWAGNSFHIKLNESDNTLQLPIITSSGIFSGHRALDCSVEPATFTAVSCTGSNILIPDDVNGKHVIKLTYGYFTNGSGSREFQEVLEKI